MSRKLKPKPKLGAARRKQPPRWQRERNVSLIIWAIVPVIIVTVLGLVGYWGYDNYVAAWKQPVLQVNNATFNMDYYVKMLRFYSRTQSTTSGQPPSPSQVLAAIEDGELIRQGAPALGIQATQDEITQAVRGNLGLPAGSNTTEPGDDFDERYQLFLDSVGLSDQDYRGLAATAVLGDKLTQYFQDNSVPTEAEQIHLHMIVVADEQAAQQALDRIRQGEDFAAMSEEYSTIEELRQAAGDCGWVPRGIYSEVDDVAFTIALGNVSEPVRTENGYSLLEVSEKADSMPIDDAYREILANNEMKSWLNEQRNASDIKRYLDQAKITWAMNQIK